MKYIEKRKPPESLERYKETAGANFDDLPSNVKSELKQQLADEQGDICCYCGKRISPDHHSVIEHLLPWIVVQLYIGEKQLLRRIPRWIQRPI